MGRRDKQSGGGGFGTNDSLMDEAQGIVKRLVPDRGFGFIRDTNGLEYFFHSSAVEGEGTFNDLQEGDKVIFRKGTGPKGPRAEHVSRLSS